MKMSFLETLDVIRVRALRIMSLASSIESFAVVKEMDAEASWIESYAVDAITKVKEDLRLPKPHILEPFRTTRIFKEKILNGEKDLEVQICFSVTSITDYGVTVNVTGVDSRDGEPLINLESLTIPVGGDVVVDVGIPLEIILQ